MLEIPESLTIAKQLNAAVKGKRIAQVETEHTKHSFAWYEGNPQEYADKMEGLVIRSAQGLCSMVDIDLLDYHFVAGDGTLLRYLEAGQKLPERYQTRITFEDGSSLICSVQMYGAMYLIKPELYDNFYYLTAKEKPQPLTAGFDYDYFTGLREEVDGSCSAKAFLATKQRIPGLCNGVLQDILLMAGIHPKQKLKTLREADYRNLYEAIGSVLEQMIQAGGRDTEKDLFGHSGGYRTKLSKNTVGKECPYCGNVIQKASYLGGTVYFCPGCQRE